MGGDGDLFLRLLSSPLGLAILASGHAAHVNTTNLRLALMDRWVGRSLKDFQKPPPCPVINDTHFRLVSHGWLTRQLFRVKPQTHGCKQIEDVTHEAQSTFGSCTACWICVICQDARLTMRRS